MRKKERKKLWIIFNLKTFASFKNKHSIFPRETQISQ